MRNVVDVIIPTFRPDNNFGEIIERIKKQTIVPENIIIVNTIPRPIKKNGLKGVIDFNSSQEQVSSDYIICKDGERLNISTKGSRPRVSIYNITQDEFDHGATRDYAVALSDAQYIILMNQNTVPLDRHMIEYLLLPFGDKSIGCTYGRQYCDSNADVIDKYAKAVNFPGKDVVKSGADLKSLGTRTYFCSNACAAYRKSIYEELGGFDYRTIFNEDMVMGAKIINSGYKIAYASKAKVRHFQKYNFKQTLQRSFDLGVLNRQYKDLFKIMKGGNESSFVLREAVKYLIKTGNIGLIPKAVLLDIAEGIGYDVGYNYEKIPAVLIKKLTMNKEYWRKNW